MAEGICQIAESSPNPFVQIPTLVCTPPPAVRQFVNLAKYSQKAFWIRARQGDQTPGITIPANQRVTMAITPPSDQGGEGDVELHMLHNASTGAYAISMYVSDRDRKLMNQPVESTLVLGYPELPGRLPQPIFVPATTSLVIELTDLSGAPNAVDLTGLGMQIVDPMNSVGVSSREMRAFYNRSSHPYWLTFDQGATVQVPASSGGQFQLTVPSDSDLNCWWLLGRATDPTTLFVEIFEGNNRRLMNGPIRFDQLLATTRAVAGFPGGLIPAAGLPEPLPFTHCFQRGTTINVVFTNTSLAPQVISMAACGQLLYDQPSPPGMAVKMPQAFAALKQAEAARAASAAGVQGLYGWR